MEVTEHVLPAVLMGEDANKSADLSAVETLKLLRVLRCVRVLRMLVMFEDRPYLLFAAPYVVRSSHLLEPEQLLMDVMVPPL